MDVSQIGKRAWGYAGVLQDAGLSCFEYVEQLTLLLFLKMADQLTEKPYNLAPLVPLELSWKVLLSLDGAALEDQYRAVQQDLVEGMELSPKAGRMCAMNVYLHGIGGDKVVIHTGHDSLSAPWGREYSMILANPPFGKKQSLLFVNEEGNTEKED